MKYILRLCGTKLEKCDFSNLLSVNKTEEIVQILKYLHQDKNETAINRNNTIVINNSSNFINTTATKEVIYPINNIMKKKNLRSEFNFKESKSRIIF